MPQLGPPGAADRAVRERIARRVELEVERFARLVREAMDAGEALPGDARRVATFMWGAWNGVIALTTRPDRLALSEEELEAVLAEGRRLVLEGLASAPPAPGRAALRARASPR